MGNALASHFLAEVGTNVCLFATGTVRANMTASISRSSFAQTCSFACLLDLFIVWHASFLVTPVMFRPCLHVWISCAIDCLACLLSGHLCHVQVLPASFKKSCLVCLASQRDMNGLMRLQWDSLILGLWSLWVTLSHHISLLRLA